MLADKKVRRRRVRQKVYRTTHIRPPGELTPETAARWLRVDHPKWSFLCQFAIDSDLTHPRADGERLIQDMATLVEACADAISYKRPVRVEWKTNPRWNAGPVNSLRRLLCLAEGFQGHGVARGLASRVRRALRERERIVKLEGAELP